MFGLSFEKLLLVAVIAAFIVGPHRLPLCAARLGTFVRAVRNALDSARQRAEADLGVPLDTSSWQVDLSRYDPRKIVRDALEPPATTAPSAPAEPARPPQDDAAAARGTSGHPRRTLLTETMPADQPAVGSPLTPVTPVEPVAIRRSRRHAR